MTSFGSSIKTRSSSLLSGLADDDVTLPVSHRPVGERQGDTLTSSVDNDVIKPVLDSTDAGTDLLSLDNTIYIFSEI